MNRALRTAGSVALIAAGLAGYAGTLALAPAQYTLPSTPRACSYPSLPSGDAERLAGGTEKVCTDGTWIPVSNYGR